MGKWENLQMCECGNVQMWEPSFAYFHILTFSHLHISSFANFPILKFPHYSTASTAPGYSPMGVLHSLKQFFPVDQ